jgi:hypothetical protein
MHQPFRILVLATAVCFAPVHAQVPSGISGAWYNPAQSGHGVSIEVLDASRAIAFWYVYDRDGRPVHLYLDGRIEGQLIRGTAYAGSGMRFGAFDPATLNLDVWGQMELEVHSCRDLTLRYTGHGAVGGAYGSGALALQRLTHLRGLDCSSDKLPEGLYQGSYDTTRPSGSSELVAAVDEDGHLWATSPRIRGPRFVGQEQAAPVVSGEPPALGPSLTLRALGNTGLDDEGSPFPAEAYEIGVAVQVFGPLQIDAPGLDSDWLGALSLRPDPQRNRRLAQPAPLGELVTRQFQFSALGQFVDDNYRLVFLDGLRICLLRNGGSCEWTGSVVIRNRTTAFFDFDIQPAAGLPNFENRPPIHGRGWAERDAQGGIGRVVLVGADARNGLGIVADAVANP